MYIGYFTHIGSFNNHTSNTVFTKNMYYKLHFITPGKAVAEDTTVLVQRRQLNHKPFQIRVNVKSDVAKPVTVRFFLAPKYDSKGYEIPLHLNSENVYTLDEFKYECKSKMLIMFIIISALRDFIILPHYICSFFIYTLTAVSKTLESYNNVWEEGRVYCGQAIVLIDDKFSSTCRRNCHQA